MKTFYLACFISLFVIVAIGCSDDEPQTPDAGDLTVDSGDVGDTTQDPQPEADDPQPEAADPQPEGDDLPPEEVGVDTDQEDTTSDTADDAPDTGEDLPCTLGGDECDEDDRCVPFGPGETLVCAPAGDVPIGEPCGTSGEDDCIEGAVCVWWDEDSAWCRALCTPESDVVACGQDYELCVPFYGMGGSIAGICLGNDCTPPAEGCDAQMRCSVLLDSTFACVPAGTVPPYGDCSEDDCQAGYICRLTDYGYTCQPFCNNTSECTETWDHCAWPWLDFTEWGYCEGYCDPILQEGCGTNEACYFSDPEEGTTDCFFIGTVEVGQPCNPTTELCVPGADCILDPDSSPPDYTYSCRAYCDGEHPCVTGTCRTTTGMETMTVCMP